MLGVLSMVLLCLLGGLTIRIIFQHGAFDAHSSALTYSALVGYAVGLPGAILAGLLVSGFYAMKDAWTPLFTGVLMLLIHFGLLLAPASPAQRRISCAGYSAGYFACDDRPDGGACYAVVSALAQTNRKWYKQAS